MFTDFAAKKWVKLMDELEFPVSRYPAVSATSFVTILFLDQFGRCVSSQRVGVISDLSLSDWTFTAPPGSRIRVRLCVTTAGPAGFSSHTQYYPAKWKLAYHRRTNYGDRFTFKAESGIYVVIPAPSASGSNLSLPGFTKKVEIPLPTGDVSLAPPKVWKQFRNLVRIRSSRAWLVLKRSRDLHPRKSQPHSRALATPINVTFPTNSVRTQGNTVISDTSGTTVVEVYSRTESRVNTPNFFTLKKWQRPINAYSMTEKTVQTRLGYERIETLDQNPSTILTFVRCSEGFFSFPAPTLVIDQEARSKAFKTLLSSMEKQQGKGESFNLAADLATFRQTANMIAANALRIVRTVRLLRKGRIDSAVHELFNNRPPKFRKGKEPSARKSLASNWLELQYGWKPLLNDIHEAIVEAHRPAHGDLRVVRASGSVIRNTETPMMVPVSGSYATVSPFQGGIQTVTTEHKVRYGIRYKVNDRDQQFLAQTGFTSPVGLAWELLPFSFVVDWFYPIGPYLESLHAFEGLSFVDGFETQFIRETSGTQCFYDAVKGTAPQRIRVTGRHGNFRIRVSMSRTKLFTFPNVPSPRLKNPISVVHAQNALALLHTVFK